MTARAYYNEIDPKAAMWLRELIAAGHIAPGDVDERSIADVEAADLAGFSQCHFFAGIGGWSYALRLAGVPDDAPVWTGSCPCQPFSCAGRGRGAADERHLWPAFANLIAQCRPLCVFGEQVAGAIGHGWLDGVQADMEAEGYAVGAGVLGAHSVGAPHIRQRLYWGAVRVADGDGERFDGDPVRLRGRGPHKASAETAGGGIADSWSDSVWWPCRDGKLRRVPARRVDDPAGARFDEAGDRAELRGERCGQCVSGDVGRDGRLPDPQCIQHQGSVSRRCEGDRPAREWPPEQSAGHSVPLPIARHDWLEVEPGLFPLADGIPGSVGLLRGAGNAIVPQVAAAFVQEFLGAVCDTEPTP